MQTTEEGLSVILPAYNEAGNLEEIIPDVVTFLRSYASKFEVIVVNDGSKDNTEEILSQLCKNYPELKAISYKENKGYGYAIRKGIKNAKFEWILIMDCDGQFKIESLIPFWERREKYDFLTGYRSPRVDNIYRKTLAKIGNLIGNFFLGYKVKDINCAFKLFRKSLIQKLNLKANGNAIFFEILLGLFKRGFKNFLQLPVKHYQRKQGKQSGGDLKVIFKLISEAIKAIFEEKGHT